MDYFERKEAIDHLSQIEGYDPSYDVTYFGHWAGYDCHGWSAILVKDENFYLLEGGYSPEVGDDKDYWDLEPISAEDAVKHMEEFEQILADPPLF